MNQRLLQRRGLGALAAWAVMATPVPALAQDRADIDRTAIVGHRELPKVLTIVPWKKPVPGELKGRPVSSVLDEALAPVDREVFKRNLDYAAQTRARDSGGATTSTR